MERQETYGKKRLKAYAEIAADGGGSPCLFPSVFGYMLDNPHYVNVLDCKRLNIKDHARIMTMRNFHHISKRILQKIFAYAIMPLGKKSGNKSI